MLLDNLEDIRSTRSINELEEVSKEVCGELGFSYLVAALDVPQFQKQSIRHFITSGSKPWMQRYLDEEFVKVDPRAAHAYASDEPLIWSENTFEDFDNAKVYEIFEGLKHNNVQSGVAIPIHGQCGVRALVSFNREEKITTSSNAKFLNKAIGVVVK